MISKKTNAISAIGLSLFLLVGCNAEPAVTKEDSKVVAVEAVKKEKGVEYSRLSGTLTPKEETIISFEIGGNIKSLQFDEGQFVNSGDVLANLDRRDYELQLEKANAAIQSSNASLSAAQASLEEATNGARIQERTQAKLNVDRTEEAYKNATADYERMKNLFETGAISAQALEGAKFNYINAEASYESAKLAYSLIEEGVRPEKEKQIKAGVNQAQAGLLNAQVSKEQAQLALAKTSLKAPFSGVITAKLASIGELVGPGAPVYKLSQMDTLRVLLPVPDYQIAEWEKGKEVSVDLYGEKKQGKVSNVFPSTNQNTGTISVEVEIPNQDHKWFPGQVVKAETKLKEQLGLFVPVEAVISTGTNNNPYVFLLQDGKAVKTEVTIGKLFDNKLEITSGLSERDRVITKGADRLFDGDSVTVEENEGTNKP
ncbi:efflux RND transporter periplasmic adaptor subunit [Schinkia azotoformans]|uniref:efflux RND transporter periplasmic adaptor subunit n=1 Tax=Schinkia azotoformans TaxID=1454 RepID=UPI002DBCFADF|nr:efflux RND transporter periplasmic adaptor subunit [Schinkia azotoformans]MEC1772366.1 efflux RND transporter periplasmic adaptor subunit [Schinkia azotoformans]MED4365873.1 efflux RND transporter periplasmic adaptor subunit [Schinkia azotoformans]